MDNFAIVKFMIRKSKEKHEEPQRNTQVHLQFTFAEPIMPALTKKHGNQCGLWKNPETCENQETRKDRKNQKDREFREDWTRDITRIAETLITRIATIIKKDGPERIAFVTFLARFREDLGPERFYGVKKMKFGRTGKEKDKTTVIYNDYITMEHIPLEAYDYVVNGKSALQWVMDRQCVKTDKASGIVNDANDYANETVGDPPLSIGTVSAGHYGKSGNHEDRAGITRARY